MKNGNISNTASPLILIRVEGTLFKKAKKGMLSIPKYEVDIKVLELIYYISFRTDYQVDLVVSPELAHKMKSKISGISLPFNNLQVMNVHDINTYLHSGMYLYYIDDNKDVLSTIALSNACSTSRVFRIVLPKRSF